MVFRYSNFLILLAILHVQSVANRAGTSAVVRYSKSVMKGPMELVKIGDAYSLTPPAAHQVYFIAKLGEF